VPRLIAIGGYPGTGKSTVAQRLSRDLRIPRLGSDPLGRAIKSAHPDVAEAQRIGFSVLFALAEDFLTSNCSVIVDTNMGWAFHWDRLDDIVGRQRATFVPVMLRCPRGVYMQRIADRHAADPTEASVEKMLRMPNFNAVCEFIDAISRPDVLEVDAGGTPDETYARVKQIVSRSADCDAAEPG
jgi:uncharacterized protein